MGRGTELQQHDTDAVAMATPVNRLPTSHKTSLVPLLLLRNGLALEN